MIMDPGRRALDVYQKQNAATVAGDVMRSLENDQDEVEEEVLSEVARRRRRRALDVNGGSQYLTITDEVVQSIETNQDGMDGEVKVARSRKRRRFLQEATPDSINTELVQGSTEVDDGDEEDTAQADEEHDRRNDQGAEDDVEVEEEDEHYEVEKIMQCQYKRGWHYRVKWKGYSTHHNTWEQWRNMRGSLDLVRELHKNNPETGGPLEWKELDLRRPPRH